jgi:hypothetical protein
VQTLAVAVQRALHGSLAVHRDAARAALAANASVMAAAPWVSNRRHLLPY